MSEEETEAGSVWDRETAPQSPYTAREVATGFAVLVVGAAVTFGLPSLL